MEVGSGRGWRWFPSGIEAFCEGLAAQESVGEEPKGSSLVRGAMVAARASVRACSGGAGSRRCESELAQL